MRAKRGLLLLAGLLLVGCGAASGGEAAPPDLGPIVQPWATLLPTPTQEAPVAPPRLPSPPPDGAEAAPPPARPGGPSPAPTPAAVAPAWTFAVVGDTWKDTPMLRYMLHDAAAAGDAFLIDLGDLTPQGRPEQFAAFARVIAGAGLPVYPVPGNHDVAWSHTTGPWAQYWPRHRAFDYRDAHFTLVDDSAVTLTAGELAWVERDLAGTRQPVKLVFMHVPAFMPYPVPSESALQAGGPEFAALMARYRATAVYAGHLHAYTREEHDGTPYVITGGGGEPLHVPGFLGGRYHYLRVAVARATVQDTVIGLEGVPTPGP